MPKEKRHAGIHLHTTEILKPTKKGKSKLGFYISKEYYWILIAKNGKTIAKSSETYKRKASAVKSILIAAEIFLGGKPYELVPYRDHTVEGTPKKHC